MPRRRRFSRTIEDHFTIDLADLGKHGVIQDLGKAHRMVWQRPEVHWVRGRHGYPERMEVTTWVSARLTRVAHDKLSVLISSKKGGQGTRLMRYRVTVHLSLRENAVSGTRLWFKCPDCGGAVRALHWSGGWLRCRRCGGLKHRTALTFKTRRAKNRAEEILHELGGAGDHWTPLPGRPRYMHWQRFVRLQGEFLRISAGLRAADNRRIERMDRSLWKSVARIQRMSARRA